VTDLLDGVQFRALFDHFKHTAWRLEARDNYAEPGENEALQRFRAGERADSPWFAEWFRSWSDSVQKWTRAGKRMERVRVVTEPLSEYIRWEMDLARLNVAAGEDIRYLPRDGAGELELPDEDFWLFDSRFAAVLRFDADDVRIGVEVIDDPVEVLKRCQWRDIAWHYAIPYRDFADGHVQD
jgi:hypothetical protein